MKKIFVGGLPFATSEEELNTMFTEFGSVESARIVTDKFTGKSRGFAFIEMPSDEEADKAIEALNGKEVEGRTLTVNEARPQKPGGGRGGPGGGRGFGGRGGGGGGRGGFGGGGRGGPGGGGGGRRSSGGGGFDRGNRW